jgi:hypothetical protein
MPGPRTVNGGMMMVPRGTVIFVPFFSRSGTEMPKVIKLGRNPGTIGSYKKANR